MNYPNRHKEIVTSLMDGRFITVDEKLFEIINEQENRIFYFDFFDKSFGFELKGTHDFYYLISDETKENTSREISIFLSIFCYELDKDGKNFLDELNYSEFSIEEIAEYFNNTSWTDVINASKQLKDRESLRKLINSTMLKRNIVTKSINGKYAFTKAYQLFIDYVRDLIKEEKID